MSQVILGLDVGHKRIGVAMGNTDIKLASPLKTLQHDVTIWPTLQALVKEYDVEAFVIGLPRGLDGQDTAQTHQTSEFIAQVSTAFDLPVHLQDEALTSVMAKAELEARGKPYVKDAIDALAATYILQDYLDSLNDANNVRNQTS